MSDLLPLLIGSSNKNKIKEFKLLLEPYFSRILSLNDFDQSFDDPPETGKTFYENAQVKADYYSNQTQMMTLSDDSGLSIPALNNWPGIDSKRMSQQYLTIEHCFHAIHNRLHGLSNNAIMTSCLVLQHPDGYSLMASGEIKGHLIFPGRGQGFDIDPYFIPHGRSETFAQNPESKQLISHRRIAVDNLISALIL